MEFQKHFSVSFLFGCALFLFSFKSLAISYNFSASSGTFTANSAPTVLCSSGCDSYVSANTNIGFTFYFGGCSVTSYTQLRITGNGYIILGAPASHTIQNTNNMSNSTYGPLLAPLWDDLNIGPAGNINYKLTGTAPNRVFTVEWLNMAWNWGSASNDVSFQVKLYETTNTIEFIYRDDLGSLSSASASIGINGGVAGDYYSLDGSGTSPNAVYGTATNTISTRPASGQVYTWALPSTMTYTSSTVSQTITTDVYQGSTNQEIISIPVTITGSCTPFNLTQLIINMTGTTSIADVTNIDIYYTGTTPFFSAGTLFGSIAPAAGNLTINGTQALQNGTNYFWVVYDVSATATVGNLLDAQCSQITMDGGVGNRVPTVTNPVGSRTIALTPSSFARWVELGWAKSVIQSSDGNLVWAGSTSNTYSSGSTDCYIIKTSSDLNTILWTYVAGTTASSEIIERIVETVDGFVFIGWSDVAGGATGHNVMVSKIDATGVLQWTRTIGTSGTDYGYGICKTSDGNVAICGPIGSGSPNDGYFAKIDNATGAIIAEKTVSASAGVVSFRAITETTDGGFLIGGKANNDFYLVKLTSAYALDWARRWGGANTDEVTFVLENAANDYTIGGTSYSYGFGGSDGYIMRFTWTGAAPSVTWLKSVGTAEGNQFTDGKKTSDGGYIMSGITFRVGDPTNNEAWAVKLNSSGNNVFMKSVGTSVASEDEEAWGVFAMADGSYALSGLHNPGPHFYMIKLSGSGYNCSVIQDNGSTMDLTAPAFTSDATVTAPSGFTTASPALTTNTGGVITGGCITIPLPIQLLNFEGYSDKNANVLKWATSSENNNKYFILEHSIDAENWETVESIKGAGNSNYINEYTLTDFNPYYPLTYYRLKQVDYNGNYDYSKIISIKNSNEQNSSILIYPNPSFGKINISISTDLEGETIIEIKNVMGQLIFSKQLYVLNNIGNTSIETQLEKGMYFVSIKNNSDIIYTSKLIINDN